MKNKGNGSIVTIMTVVLFLAACASHQKKAPEPQQLAAETAKASETLQEATLLEQARSAGALQNIFFDFDKHHLKPKAKNSLIKTADWLAGNPSVKIRIEGHCDERGTNEYNLALGQRRADSAKLFLIAAGIEPERITTLSYGEEMPADPEHSEGAWSKNRRDELKIIDDEEPSDERLSSNRWRAAPRLSKIPSLSRDKAGLSGHLPVIALITQRSKKSE
ncbi:peptidoglycan-associated lipoprotein Pal [Thermodesulfobacteriota bacterium]